MPNQNEVKIIITSDASGAVTGVKMLEDQTKTSVGNQAGGISQLKGHWLGITAAIASVYAAYATYSKAMEFAEIGAKALQAEQAFAAVAKSANENADQIIAAMKRATRGTIDESALMQKAVVGMAQGLSATDMIKIAEMSTTTAVKRGIEVQDAFDRITDSVANNLPRALKFLGLVTLEQFKILNQAVTLGIDDINLLEIAYLNFQVQQKKMGGEVDNVALALQRHRAEIQATKEEWSKFFITVVGGLLEFGSTVSKYMVMSPEGGGVLPEGYDNWTAALNRAAKSADPAAELAKKMEDAKKKIDEIKGAEKAKQLAQDMISWQKAVEVLNPTLTDLEKQLVQVNEQSEKLKQKYGDQSWITKGSEQAKYFIEIAQKIKEATETINREEKEWTERALAEKDYIKQMALYRADAIEKRLLGEEEAGLKIKDIAFKASRTVEEYLEREAEITRLVEEKKLVILEEYRLKRQRDIFEKENTMREQLQNKAMYTGGEAGALGAGLQMLQQGMWGMFNQGQGTDPYSIQLENLRLFWEEKINQEQQGNATLQEVEDAHQAWALAMDQQTNAMRLQSAQSTLSTILGVTSMFYAASGSQSKALFYTMKAVAVAMALMNAYLAYTFALADPNPLLTVEMRLARAQMVLWQGIAAAATIAATAFMGPSAGAGVGGSATGVAATSVTPAPSAATETQKSSERPLVINIHVSGDIVNKDEWLDGFAREIVPKIRQAQEDGVR